jgi:phosphatidylserine/phosphatidylglycerophosphate/cardiolipin synthase-like enzyme
MDDPRISFTWPSVVESTFGTNLADDINRLVKKTKFELVIMAYNLNVTSEFFLQQTIRDRLRVCKPNIRLYCDNYTTASSFADLFYDWKECLDIHYWTDTSDNYSKFHIKAIAVDKNLLYIGSANFSETAMGSSAECGLFLSSPDCYESLIAYTKQLHFSGLLTKFN